MNCLKELVELSFVILKALSLPLDYSHVSVLEVIDGPNEHADVHLQIELALVPFCIDTHIMCPQNSLDLVFCQFLVCLLGH